MSGFQRVWRTMSVRAAPGRPFALLTGPLSPLPPSMLPVSLRMSLWSRSSRRNRSSSQKSWFEDRHGGFQGRACPPFQFNTLYTKHPRENQENQIPGLQSKRQHKSQYGTILLTYDKLSMHLWRVSIPCVFVSYCKIYAYLKNQAPQLWHGYCNHRLHSKMTFALGEN